MHCIQLHLLCMYALKLYFYSLVFGLTWLPFFSRSPQICSCQHCGRFFSPILFVSLPILKLVLALRFSFKCFAKTLITHFGRLTTTQCCAAIQCRRHCDNNPPNTEWQHKMRLFHSLLMSIDVIVFCCRARTLLLLLLLFEEWGTEERTSEKIQHETNFSSGI